MHGRIAKATDRTKDLIKSGGEWISSVALESALMAYPKIKEAAVIAIPDLKWSESPLTSIVLANENEKLVMKNSLNSYPGILQNTRCPRPMFT